jgi:hypothetical protein
MQLIHSASLCHSADALNGSFCRPKNDEVRINMYGFGEMRSDNSLVGAELIQVCFGLNEIILRFHPEHLSITVLSRDNFIDKNPSFIRKTLGKNRAGSVFGSTVEEFVVIDDNTACLNLSCGERTILEDDSSEFEAVIFSFGSKSIVV